MTGETFGTLHVALTALITGAVVFAFALGLLGRGQFLDALAVAVLTGLTVFLWRQSANMPQLNGDGLSGFSANDWLAPVVVFVALGCYSPFRPSVDQTRFAKLQAVAAIVALVVNVVTI